MAGEGVADVLFGDYNPTGKLSFSWPKNMNQFPINPEDDHLYNFGYEKVTTQIMRKDR